MPEQTLSLARLLKCYGLVYADLPDFIAWADGIRRTRASRKKDPTVYGEDRNDAEGSEDESPWKHG